MHLRTAGTLILSAALTLALPSAAAFAQQNDSGAKQDMKAAGHETSNAAKDTGHGVEQGTKKSYHATKHVTKKSYHKTKHFTKKVGHDIEGKPDTQGNNPR